VGGRDPQLRDGETRKSIGGEKQYGKTNPKSVKYEDEDLAVPRKEEREYGHKK